MSFTLLPKREKVEPQTVKPLICTKQIRDILTNIGQPLPHTPIKRSEVFSAKINIGAKNTAVFGL